MSIIEIPIKQIKTLPALGGEVDIMKAMQLMPGVQSGNEGSSGLYVRGGSPDQNLVLIDDKKKSKNQLKWGNMLGAFRWNHLYNQKLFSNLTLTYTRYRYLSEFSATYQNDNNITEHYYNAFNSNINDFSGKIDFEYYISPNIKMKFGGNSVYHIFIPGIESYKYTETNTALVDTSFNNQDFSAFESAIYVENVINVGKRIKANIGLRASNYYINKRNFSSIEPRVLLNLLITDNLSIKNSFSSMKQYLHLLSYSGIGLPSDFWVPATKKVPPEKSYQYAIGLAQSLYHNSYELSIEGYYKKLENLITFAEGATFFGNSKDWQEKVETGGKGESYGIEFLLQKKVGKITGWVGYTVSKTERLFRNVNSGKPFPYRYDRRHDISFVVNYHLNDNISFSGTWVYGTGNAITLPVAYTQDN